MVMALINDLRQKSWHPGVISRGYGVHIGSQARTGHGALAAEQFGDEPALIAQSTGVPVAVHPSRIQAAKALLQDYPEVNVIVADDGLQHLQLGRDVEIVVQDNRGTGNGRLLPAGPLREPVARLTRVDVLITNQPSRPTHDNDPALADSVTEAPDRPMQVSMTLVPHEVIHIHSGRRQSWKTWLADHHNTPLSAVAAIGHPERFFNMLRQQGLTLQHTCTLPDHTSFSASTFEALSTDPILITSKDAVKCKTLNDDRLWSVNVTPEFSQTNWLDHVHDTLVRAAQHRQPGSNTTQAVH